MEKPGEGPGSLASSDLRLPVGTGDSRSWQRAGMPLLKHLARGEYVLPGKVDVTPTKDAAALTPSGASAPSQVPLERRRGGVHLPTGTSPHPQWRVARCWQGRR